MLEIYLLASFIAIILLYGCCWIVRKAKKYIDFVRDTRIPKEPPNTVSLIQNRQYYYQPNQQYIPSIRSCPSPTHNNDGKESSSQYNEKPIDDSSSEGTTQSACVVDIEPSNESILTEFFQKYHIVLDTNILIEVHQLENFVKKYPFCTYVFPRVVMAELTFPNGKPQITLESGRIKFNTAHLNRIFDKKKIIHQTTASMKRVNCLVGPNNNEDKDHKDTLIGYCCTDYLANFPGIQVYLLTRDVKFISRSDEFDVTIGYFDSISNILTEQSESHCIKKLADRNQDMSSSCSEERMSV